MDWIWPFIHAILGILGWEFGKYISRTIRTSYRWKCKQCGFKIKTSSLETYNISRSSHNHSSTREYK